MNATKCNASSISRKLNKLDIFKSETSRTRVSEFTSEGYRVKQLEDGVLIDYVGASNSRKMSDEFRLRQFLAIEKIFIELSWDGYEVTLDWPSIKVGA